MLRKHDVHNRLNLGGGVRFHNDLNAINNNAQHQKPPRGRRPDQICVFKREQGIEDDGQLAFVVEYKAPHKLTFAHLKAGLRDANIYDEVVHRVTQPNSHEHDAVSQYHSDKLTAAAVTQTYDYMINTGVNYGSVTTGEAFVLLKVDWEESECSLLPSDEPSGRCPSEQGECCLLHRHRPGPGVHPARYQVVPAFGVGQGIDKATIERMGSGSRTDSGGDAAERAEADATRI